MSLQQPFADLYSTTKSGSIQRLATGEYDGDPRGIIWIWDPPKSSSKYIIGVDPANGAYAGWNRWNRSKEDKRFDNGVVEVFRVGNKQSGEPDRQVCEFAAPIDPFELGDIVNLLGRLYAGVDQDQCSVILEIYPGPGSNTLQRLFDKGYMNFFRWQYYADTPAQDTRSFGWHATPKSNRDLWIKASRHIAMKSCIIKSPWAVEEYADARMNDDKGWAQNLNGHDDRVRAINLALWHANMWVMDVERTEEKVSINKEFTDWQASDMSMEEIYSDWEDRMDQMQGGDSW